MITLILVASEISGDDISIKFALIAECQIEVNQKLVGVNLRVIGDTRIIKKIQGIPKLIFNFYVLLQLNLNLRRFCLSEIICFVVLSVYRRHSTK